MNWKERICFFILVYFTSSVFFNIVIFTVLWLFNHDYSWSCFTYAQAAAFLPFALKFIDK